MRTFIIIVLSSSLLYSSEEVEVLKSPSRDSFPTKQQTPQEQTIFQVTYNRMNKPEEAPLSHPNSPLHSRNSMPLITLKDDSLQKILACTSNKELIETIQDIREKLSHFPQRYEDLIELKKSFEKQYKEDDVLKNTLEIWTAINQVKWSTQETKFQALMGHLFFPVQYDSLFESSSALYTREPLQYLIGLSASYGNLLAQVHLENILEIYDESHLTEPTLSVIDKLVKTVPSEIINEPRYYCGLLCIRQGQLTNDSEHFKIGYEDGDLWCSYRHGLELRGEEASKPVIKQLMKMNLGLAKLLQADLEDDDEQRKATFVEAGKEGIAEGYFVAGILEDDSKVSSDYYIKAAQGFMLDAYDNAAEIYLKEGNSKKALELYCEKAQAGDPCGYVLCGDLLRNLDQNNEALEYYEKAGLNGYHDRIHCINNLKRKEALTQEKNELISIKIKKLKGIFDENH